MGIIIDRKTYKNTENNRIILLTIIMTYNLHLAQISKNTENNFSHCDSSLKGWENKHLVVHTSFFVKANFLLSSKFLTVFWSILWTSQQDKKMARRT